MAKETKNDDVDTKADVKRRPRRIKSGGVASKGSSTSLKSSITSTTNTIPPHLDSENQEIPAPPKPTPSMVSTASSTSGVKRLDSAKQRTTRGRSGEKLKRSNSSDDETTLVDQNNHQDDSTDASLFTPGAYSVSANDSVEFRANNDDILENKKEKYRDPVVAPVIDANESVVVAAEVVTDNEEKGKVVDEEDLELKIAKAVESRLKQRDQAVVVAEVVPPPTDPIKGDAPLVYHQSCAQCCSDCCIKWKYPIIFLLLCSIGAIVAISLLAGGSPEPSYPPPPSSSGTADNNRPEQIKQTIQQGANLTVFEDPNSPQSLALEWLLSDSVTMSPSNLAPPSIILQRYALAVLYYSTSGNRWTNQLNFLTDRPSCEWNDGSRIPFPTSASALPSLPDTFGVQCDNIANVKQVRLAQNGLNGTLPAELTLLVNLQALGVDQNALAGSIPADLARLSDMRMVMLDTNYMTGTIPTELGLWTPLQSFHANDNQFDGTLPTEFGQLGNLQELYVYNNYLTGTVPSTLSNNGNVDVMFDPQLGA